MRKEKSARTTAPAHALAAALGVQVNQQGSPDLYRRVPSRFVTKSEAEAAGASMYYDGTVCRAGHVAARWVSNPNRCADCERLKKGLPTIYPSSLAGHFYAEPRRKPKDAVAPVVVQAAVPTPLEPDTADKRFLSALAECRHFATAAANVGTTVSAVQSRISFNQPFRDAIMDLTERLQIPHPVQVSVKRELTPEEHEVFCRVWIDTGSQSKARAAIGITASQMHDELERSGDFQDMFADAAPKAALALDDTAVDLSLAGNDKLLSKTLPAKLREQYTERMNLNMNVNRVDKMSDEQLQAELVRAFKQLYLLSPQEFEKTAQEAHRLAQLEQSAKVIDVECTTIPDAVPTTEAQNTRNAGACCGTDATD